MTDDAPRSRLSEMIEAYCRARRIKQAELAQHWRCGESVVSRLLHDGRVPRGETMSHLIAWLLDAEPIAVAKVGQDKVEGG